MRYALSKSFIGKIFVKLAKIWSRNEVGLLKILIYHDVSKSDFPKFETQIKYLAKTYEFINPKDLPEILAGTKFNTETKILLTFDDGFMSNYELAQEYLNPAGIKAVYFIAPGFINANNREQEKEFISQNIYIGDLKTKDIPDEMTHMNWREIRQLLDQGHTIGAHTVNHRRLSEITNEDDLRYEIEKSGDQLQKILNVDIEHFAYPFGDIGSIDSRVINVINQSYKYCYSGIRGCNSGNTHPMAILRESISVDYPITYLQFVLAGGLSILYWKRMSILNKYAKGN